MWAKSQISVGLGKIKKCGISYTAVCDLKFIPIAIGIWKGWIASPDFHRHSFGDQKK